MWFILKLTRNEFDTIWSDIKWIHNFNTDFIFNLIDFSLKIESFNLSFESMMYFF